MDNHYHLLLQTLEPHWAQAVRPRPPLGASARGSGELKRTELGRVSKPAWRLGRELGMYLGREKAGMKLAELAAATGSATVVAVSMAFKRFAPRMETDPSLRRLVEKAQQQL